MKIRRNGINTETGRLHCYEGPVGLLAAAITASAVYTGEQQKKAAKKQAEATRAAQEAQAKAAKEAQDQQNRIELAAQTRQEEMDKAIRKNVDDTETAKVTYGVDESKKSKTVSSDLLIPRKSAGTSLGTTSSNRTGLGF